MPNFTVRIKFYHRQRFSGDNMLEVSIKYWFAHLHRKHCLQTTAKQKSRKNQVCEKIDHVSITFIPALCYSSCRGPWVSSLEMTKTPCPCLTKRSIGTFEPISCITNHLQITSFQLYQSCLLCQQHLLIHRFHHAPLLGWQLAPASYFFRAP
jgi:hypothetical protein